MSEPKSTQKRILLIEDDADVRPALEDILRHAGFDVLAAVDGKDGLARFRQGGFDLVITDIIMPKQDGVETILALRRMHPGLRIIAISGGGRMLGTGYLKTVVRNMGVNQLLEKPFLREQLLQAIGQALGGGAVPA